MVIILIVNEDQTNLFYLVGVRVVVVVVLVC